MKIGTKLLYAFVKERYPVARFGKAFQSDDLPLPVFYHCTMQALQEGARYLVRTQDLPRICRANCLFLKTVLPSRTMICGFWSAVRWWRGPAVRPGCGSATSLTGYRTRFSKTFHTSYKQRIHMREPYTYKGQRENPEGDNYCINLFQGSSYLGTCTEAPCCHGWKKSSLW